MDGKTIFSALGLGISKKNELVVSVKASHLFASLPKVDGQIRLGAVTVNIIVNENLPAGAFLWGGQMGYIEGYEPDEQAMGNPVQNQAAQA